MTNLNRQSQLQAPGAPAFRRAGRRAPRAASAPRSAAASRVWFTLSHGILNEIYYPRVDSRLHARPRPDRHRRRVIFLRGEARRAVGGLAARAGRAGVSPSQHRPRRALPHRKRRPDRSRRRTSCCSASASCRSRVARRLSPLCAARAAPGQPRRGNTAWVGDYKGVPMLFAERERLRAGAGVLRALARALGRASSASPTAGRSCAPTDDWRETYDARGERQRRADGRDRSHRVVAEFVLALASARRRLRRASTPSPACSGDSTSRRASTSTAGTPGIARERAAAGRRTSTPGA